MPGGRKPKYNPERVQIIHDAIAAGDTYEVAAAKAGISVKTLYEWQAEKGEFADTIKRAKAEFERWQNEGILEDAKKSLKVLVCGTEYTETKTEYEPDPKNPSQPRIKRQTTTTKRILPNPTAVIFALCNRDPENWKNRISQELSGKVETEQTGPGVSLANVPDDLLAQVIEAIKGK